MAYFNFNLAEKNRLSPIDIINLQLIKQNKFENLSKIIEDIFYDDGYSLDEYEKEGFVSYIKGTTKQSIYEKIRLTKKGEELLEMIETPDVEEDDVKILNWLIKVYNSEDKVIGNKKRTASGIASFRANTGIEKNKLAFLLRTFINDEKNFEYSQKLENLFFNSKNIYQRRFVLDDCKLYEYYLRNKEYFDKEFENL